MAQKPTNITLWAWMYVSGFVHSRIQQVPKKRVIIQETQSLSEGLRVEKHVMWQPKAMDPQWPCLHETLVKLKGQLSENSLIIYTPLFRCRSRWSFWVSKSWSANSQLKPNPIKQKLEAMSKSIKNNRNKTENASILLLWICSSASKSEHSFSL